MILFGWVNAALARFARVGGRGRQRLYDLIATYSGEDTASLRDTLEQLRRGTVGTVGAGTRRRTSDDALIHALAIAVVLFDRYPCDLPAHERLYPEQIDAAYYLVSGRNVQMDTGEGKTYVAVVAAIALSIVHPLVLILTATPYLASRDARRVEPLLRAAGLDLQHGLPDPDHFAGVAYVTLAEVTFGYLHRTYVVEAAKARYPDRAALIIDELDSVVVDQSGRFHTSRTIRISAGEWARVAALASRIDDSQYDVDPVDGTIQLGVGAWQRVAALALVSRRPVSLLIEMTTSYLWARRAREGREYIIRDGYVMLIDSITGLPFYTNGTQARALEYMRSGKVPNVTVSIAQVNSLALLSRHPFVVGLSGTLKEEVLYFLQIFHCMTAVFAPRFPRSRAPIVNRVFKDRQTCLEYIVERVSDEAATRPIVVGTWSVEEAHAVHDAVAQASGRQVLTQLLTAFDTIEDEDPVARAGEPGVVTVTSQAGSRGIDIRSRHRPLLLVLGRAREPRLDRQFLGRVGRHGEPFDAEFLLHPGMPSLPPAPGLTLLADGQVANGQLQRYIRRMQRQAWAFSLRRRQRLGVLHRVEDSIERSAAATFATARDAVANDGGVRFVMTQVEAIATQAGALDPPVPETELAKLRHAVNSAIEQRRALDAQFAAVRSAYDEAVANARASGATHLEQPGQLRIFYHAHDEVAEIARWRAQWNDADSDRRVKERQLAGLQGYDIGMFAIGTDRALPAVLEETLNAWNMRYIAESQRELGSLRVSISRDAFHRRASLSLRSIADDAADNLPRQVVDNVVHLDRPAKLQTLFYAREHMASSGPQSDHRSRVDTRRPSHEAERRDERVTAWLDGFFESAAATGGKWQRVMAEADARAVLVSFCRSALVGTRATVRSPTEREVNRFSDTLAARRARPKFVHAARHLMADFVDYLVDLGVADRRIPRLGFVASTTGQIMRFARTVPRVGLAAVVAEAVLLVVALLVTGPSAPPGGLLDRVGDIFGLQTLLLGRPLLLMLAVSTLMFAVLHAAFDQEDFFLPGNASPIIAAGAVALGYGLADRALPYVILATLVAVCWMTLLVIAERFVSTLVAAYSLLVFAAVSVVAFLVDSAGTRAGLVGIVGIGVVQLAWSGPSLQVTFGSVDYSDGASSVHEASAKRRLAVDTNLQSALIAFPVSALLFGLDTERGLLPMAAVQLLVVVLQTWAKLGMEDVEGLLTRLAVGTPMTRAELARWLSRQKLTYALGRAALLGGGAALAAQTHATNLEFLLLQLAGLVVVRALVSMNGIMMPAGPMPRLDEGGRPAETLRARVRELRRSRLWTVRYLLGFAAGYRLVSTIADLLDIGDLLKSAGRFVLHLFI